tara:strand:- start:1785 stop:2174 length:390 start_codon:yes stop_codon:yes gene_type:complete
MSTLKADTIQSTSGGAATLTKQHAAKAWINMDGTGTIATRDSFNISSITDSATGVYQHNSTNAMSSDDYTCVYNAGNGSGNSNDPQNPGNGFSSSHPNTASQTVMETQNHDASNSDREYIGGNWHGDLA